MSKMRKEYDPNKVTRRKRKPIIYIICEGKETETLYFKHFRSRNCLVDIIPISSKHKAAEHLVKHAKSLISQADYYPKDGDQLRNMQIAFGDMFPNCMERSKCTVRCDSKYIIRQFQFGRH